MVHSWRLNEGGGVSDELQPKLLTFWQCCVEGMVEGVGLYMAAGQTVDETQHLRRRSNKHTGLAFAALHNQARVCEVSTQQASLWCPNLPSVLMAGVGVCVGPAAGGCSSGEGR